MLSFPYALSFLSDVLRMGSVGFHLMRFDEQSGSGDGRIWTAELARPIWQVSLPLTRCKWDQARRIDARLRALQGSKRDLLWADPTYQTTSNPGAGVTVSTIAADRASVTLAGLPPNYNLRAGDRFSIPWGGGRHYLAEVAEDVVASGAGVAAGVGVMPFVPLGIANGAAANLIMPTLKLFIPPGGHTPYTAMLGGYSEGASLTLLQRL